MKDFLLESLSDLQRTLLVLMERAGRARVAEAANLEWTLTDVITGYRDLRTDKITWQQALRVYQTASNVQLDCEMAVMDADLCHSMDWQYCKRLMFEGAQP